MISIKSKNFAERELTESCVEEMRSACDVPAVRAVVAMADAEELQERARDVALKMTHAVDLTTGDRYTDDDARAALEDLVAHVEKCRATLP